MSRSTSSSRRSPPEDVAGYVTDAAARTGATTYKVKVGGPGSALADDLARVATVRAALSEAGVRDPLLRLDANGGWTVTEARRAARMFAAEFGPVLDYLEQPCRTATELAELRYRLVDDDVSVRIAVDEGLRRVAGPLRRRPRRARCAPPATCSSSRPPRSAGSPERCR